MAGELEFLWSKGFVNRWTLPEVSKLGAEKDVLSCLSFLSSVFLFFFLFLSLSRSLSPRGGMVRLCLGFSFIATPDCRYNTLGRSWQESHSISCSSKMAFLLLNGRSRAKSCSCPKAWLGEVFVRLWAMRGLQWHWPFMLASPWLPPSRDSATRT